VLLSLTVSKFIYDKIFKFILGRQGLGVTFFFNSDVKMPKSYLEFAAGSTHSMATEVMFQLEIYN